MKTVFTAILTLMTLFYASFASAEIYKWVDAKGETHFSDKPHKSASDRARKQPLSVKRKPRKKTLRTVSVQRTKPRKLVVSRSEPAFRTAKITQGKKTRQVSRPVVKKKTQAKRQIVRKATPAVVKPIAAQQATTLSVSLNETFYDLEKIVELTPETEAPQSKTITNFKQSLCSDNRRHLAVLQEQGFDYYYDDEDELRVAWGVEGFYRQKKRYLSASEVAKKTKLIAVEIERYCDNAPDKALQVKARQDWIRSEYCDVSKVILDDLKHPFMRTPEKEIKEQEKEVERFCLDYPANKHRDDERYYPTSLHVERLQQKYFLYR